MTKPTTDLLVIGLSNIARRRVLPALALASGIGRVHVASRTTRASAEVFPPGFPSDRRGHLLRGYHEALEEFDGDLVYVSLPNALHAEWVWRALSRGHHVAVDKPAFLALHDAIASYELAAERRCVLAEAVVWEEHPRIAMLRAELERTGVRPHHAVAVFSFPPLDAANIRYDSVLGGGSLYDLGPYAVSCGRLIFEAEPTEIVCRRLRHQTDGGGRRVDISFAVLARYPGGGVLTGHFGFTTEYRNRLDVFGPGVALELEHVFSIAPGVMERLVVRREDVRVVQSAPPGDVFLGFFERFLRDVRDARFDLNERCLSDARVLAAMRRAAGVPAASGVPCAGPGPATGGDWGNDLGEAP